MKVEIDYEDIKKLETDSRGRLNLGTEHSEEEVTIAILNKKPKE